MDTVETRLVFLVANFWINAVSMATSHLMTGRYFPHFGLNSYACNGKTVGSHRKSLMLCMCTRSTTRSFARANDAKIGRSRMCNAMLRNNLKDGAY